MTKESSQLIEDAACAVLCGGRARRMGADKAFVHWRGRPIIQHVIDAASRVFSNVVLSIRDGNRLGELGLPIVRDILDLPSPLAGIHAVLKTIEQDRAVIIAVDMPLIDPRLLRFLATVAPEADVAVPRIRGFFEPLLAVYSTRCAPFIEKGLKSGSRKVIGFFEDVNVHVVEQAEIEAIDPQLRSFVNVNSQADLKELEATHAPIEIED